MNEQETETAPWTQGALMGTGTWAWGDKLIWGYGRSHTDDDIRAAYELSLAGGIQLFDTAEVYGMGRSERLLGQFVNGQGSKVVIVTKFFPYPWRVRREALLRALRSSLERLGQSRADLYLIHQPFSLVSNDVWVEALADAVAAGLTAAVGVSNFNLERMQRAQAVLAKRGVALGANQVEYHLLQRGPEKSGLLQACQESGVTLMAYSPLAQGALTGKYGPDNPPPGVRRWRLGPGRLAQVEPLVTLLREIGLGHGGKTPSQVALNWVIAKGAMPIPGAKNGRQAAENAGARGWHLAEDEVAALDALSDEVAGSG